MYVGKLPTGITVNAIVDKLQLDSEERVLFVCQANESKSTGVKGDKPVFVFTNAGIYSLHHQSLEVLNHQDRSSVRSVNFTLGTVAILFLTEEWHLGGIDKDGRKNLEAICEANYPKLSIKEIVNAKKMSAPKKQNYLDDVFGEVILTAKFGLLKKVSLHSKGYISGLGPKPEKLLAISGDANVTKKSGLGRGLGAMVTLPLSGFTMSNLDGSNMRGDVYITIVTEIKTHTIHIDMQNQMSGQNPVGEMQKLVTTGEALIKRLSSSPEVSAPVQQPSADLASQLSNLNQLFQQGALSEAEFNAAKARILGT